jgi:hypothetical protein
MMLARDNPFATDRLAAIAFEPQGWTWSDLLTRLRKSGFRGAIVGRKGTGKTTLLKELRLRLADQGIGCVDLNLYADKRKPDRDDWSKLNRGKADGAIILLDGAEQLSTFRWLQFRLLTRRSRGLIITVHRPGRLTTLVQTETSPALLRKIVSSLDPETDIPDSEEIHVAHSGNLRDALFELYDRRERAARARALFHPSEDEPPKANH